MVATIVFYQLTRKFLEPEQKARAPQNSRQLVRYALALGHHIGVIDCFSARLEVPADGFRAWLARLPEGEGRRKLQGVLRFGEIEVSAPYVPVLRDALRQDTGASADELEWARQIGGMLDAMADEPAIYLMVRVRE
ncbi:formate hydrogenlyase maturation HycH family protein [Burkholderia multivorans]|uniref:formate hydrogenlyase maturation HycH family protein n=1 Tax=Burkholderia multivorans TaxID=87883 RepID=UPI0015E2A205|nr:formate hydrogenlyase maturation HycH family protein [Burkholderia multivorans]